MKSTSSLVFKYGTILVAHSILSSFLINMFIMLFIDLMGDSIGDDFFNNKKYFEVLAFLSTVIINSIVAIILYFDSKESRYKLIIIILALFYPLASVAFLFIDHFDKKLNKT